MGDNLEAGDRELVAKHQPVTNSFTSYKATETYRRPRILFDQESFFVS